MEGPGLVLAMGLALIHAFAPKLNIAAIIPEHRWVSFGGGVSIGYVFLEIFPELSHAQQEIEHVSIPFIDYVEHHVYLLALLGLLVFYGLDIWALSSRQNNQAKYEIDYPDETIFWVHIGFFGGINTIFGYLLQNLAEHSLVQCMLFFVAIALHFFIIDYNLREHHKGSYDKEGRWILTGAVMVGAIVAQMVHLKEAAVLVVWSFLAGSFILNILKRELPDENESCFWSFTGGATLYTILLLLTQ